MDAQPLRRDRFYVRVGTVKIPFQPPTAPFFQNLADYAECCLCGAICDVNSELTLHAAEHAGDAGSQR